MGRAVRPAISEPRSRTLALDNDSGRMFLAVAKLGPAPMPTKDVPEPRAPMLPDSFVVLLAGE